MDYNKLLKIADIIRTSNDRKQITSYHIHHALSILSLYNDNCANYNLLNKCKQLVDNYEDNKILPNNYSIVCDFIKSTNCKLTKDATIYFCGLYL